MTGGSRHLRRVYWNLRLFGLPRPVADLWLIVVTGLVLWSLTAIQSTVDIQRAGRRTAIEAICGIEQGVIDAGRGQLLHFGQRAAATSYGRTVARAVERESGVPGLVQANGQLRCDRLIQRAHAR